MSYSNEILSRLSDNDSWPKINREEFFDELTELAKISYEKNTSEGYLASVLIYNQLCEEITRVLIESSWFFIQLKVFPLEFRTKDLKKLMFGQLLQELSFCPSNEGVKNYIQKCYELNELRIKMVHKITLKTNVKDIENQCSKVKMLFEVIREMFEEQYDWYRVTFEKYKRDILALHELIK